MTPVHAPLAIHIDAPGSYWIASCTNHGCCRDDEVHLATAAEAVAYARSLIALSIHGPADDPNPYIFAQTVANRYVTDWRTHTETHS